MAMQDIAKDVLVKGLILGAVGVLLSLAAPYIGMAMGVVGGAATYAAAATELHHVANPLWLGPFFGGFGVLEAIVAPVVKWAIGEKTPAVVNAPEAKEKAGARPVQIAIIQAPQQSQAQGIVDVNASHRQKIEAEKIALLLGEQTPRL